MTCSLLVLTIDLDTELSFDVDLLIARVGFGLFDPFLHF